MQLRILQCSQLPQAALQICNLVVSLPLAASAYSDGIDHSRALLTMKNPAALLRSLFLGTLLLATSAFADSEGTVKKVDPAAGKITLAHGPLTNLNMPAMTMAFAVKDRQWLSKLKPGDKVSFVAEQVNGRLTVTSLHVVP